MKLSKTHNSNYKQVEMLNDEVYRMLNGDDSFSYTNYVRGLNYVIILQFNRSHKYLDKYYIQQWHEEVFGEVQEKLLSVYDTSKCKPSTFIFRLVHNFLFDKHKEWYTQERNHCKLISKWEERKETRISNYVTDQNVKNRYEQYDKYTIAKLTQQTQYVHDEYFEGIEAK